MRLVAKVFANELTGQVTTVFQSPPEQPFSNLKIKFERGVLAPVANPLICGEPKGVASFEPTDGGSSDGAPFGQSVTGCASRPPPFTPGQSTANSNGNGGARTNFTFNLARNDGEQYLSSVKTELPPGLVGKISLANGARKRWRTAKRRRARRAARSARPRCSRAPAAGRSRSPARCT